MKYLKKFESLFSNKPKNNRISVDELMFSKLCENGFIDYDDSKIPIDSEEFQDLIKGKIISINHDGENYQLALKDIGLNRIYQYVSKSKFYK